MLFKKKKKPEVKLATIHLQVFTKDGKEHFYSDVVRYGMDGTGIGIDLNRKPETRVFFNWEFVTWYRRTGKIRVQGGWLEGIEG